MRFTCKPGLIATKMSKLQTLPQEAHSPVGRWPPKRMTMVPSDKWGMEARKVSASPLNFFIVVQCVVQHIKITEKY